MRVLLFVLIFLQYPALAQFPLTRDQWRQDLTYLRSELPTRHPNVFTGTVKTTFERDLDVVLANLAGSTDLQIALAAQAAVARAGDSQTFIDLQPLLQKEPVVPIGLGWYGDGLFVSGTIQYFRTMLGKRVVSVGGLSTDALMQRLSRYVPAETDRSVYRDGLLYLRFPAVWRELGLSNNDTLPLVLENAAGQRETAALYAVDMQVLRSEAGKPAPLPRRAPDLRWQASTGLYRLEWLAADSIIYFQYNQCLSQEMALAAGQADFAARLPVFAPWADSLVALVGRHPKARLFVDLRFNPGGWSTDGRALADRLAQLKKRGKTYVAVNLYTALAGVELADYFREKIGAVLLGEIPAQRRYHTGEVPAFKLPQTQLEVRYSLRYKPRPGTPAEQLLFPDVRLELPFAAFSAGRDPVLDYVRRKKE